MAPQDFESTRNESLTHKGSEENGLRIAAEAYRKKTQNVAAA